MAIMENGEYETSEYGTICVVCLEPATERRPDGWYCEKHAPAKEDEQPDGDTSGSGWGGKRENAGRKQDSTAGSPYLKPENWTEHPTFWQYCTLFSTRAAAVNASLRIEKLLKIITQVRQVEQFEDGSSVGFRYAVYTQYEPFSRLEKIFSRMAY